METTEIGTWEGDTCGRNGCKGIIALEPVESCSCHISPPCGACESQVAYCPVCNFRSDDNKS
jgi:hypothetical protein